MTADHTTDTERALLATIVECSDDAIISKTLDGRITSWNAGAERIFGYTAAEMIGEPILRIIPPELHAEDDIILAKLRRGERIRHYETVRIAKGGRRLNIALTVLPVRDAKGRIVGASKVARDITELKQAEALQRLLIEELNHRVKNTLSTIQAVASQSLRLADSPRDFIIGFSGRVQALARAHTLIVETRFQGCEVADILRDELLSEDLDRERIFCTGPHLLVDPQTTVHLAMVLHELANNARKFGALSVPAGRIDVTWQMIADGERKLVLEWQESGGPKVTAPTRRGFGTALIEKTMRAHGGNADLRYGADGLACMIELPLVDEDRSSIGTFAAELEAASVPAEPMREHPLDSKRILVVEDEPLVSMDLEDGLSSVGCDIVGPTGNLDEARRLVDEEQFDAALLDVNLAGRPVDELAIALTRKNIPFAFVTGYGREALPRGFQHASMLAKPFGRDQLLAIAESLLGGPPAERSVVALRSTGSLD